MTHHNCPYDLNHVPIHRMNSLQATAWVRGGEPRRFLGAFFAKTYPDGCAVTECGYRLIGWVDKKGNCFDIPPPHRSIHFSKVANAPKADFDCPCREFYDPEIGGPWKLRNSSEHHPQCQFEPASMKVWALLKSRGFMAPAGVAPWMHKAPEMRPDYLEMLRQEARGG